MEWMVHAACTLQVRCAYRGVIRKLNRTAANSAPNRSAIHCRGNLFTEPWSSIGCLFSIHYSGFQALCHIASMQVERPQCWQDRWQGFKHAVEVGSGAMLYIKFRKDCFRYSEERKHADTQAARRSHKQVFFPKIRKVGQKQFDRFYGTV